MTELQPPFTPSACSSAGHTLRLDAMKTLLPIGLLAALSALGQTAEPPDANRTTPPAVDWSGQEIVLIGELRKLSGGVVGRSTPPSYSYKLEVKVEEILRGDLPNRAPGLPPPPPGDAADPVPPDPPVAKPPPEKGRILSLRHYVRQEKPPLFPEDLNRTRCYLALESQSSSYRLLGWELADGNETREKAVRLVCSLPFGWKTEGGDVVSPWAASKKRWPAEPDKPDEKFTCASTGRPSFEWNSKAELSVSKVPSVWQTNLNRDGDGEMKVTVSNFTEEPLVIPALRRTDERILWEESLVVLINGRAFPAPGFRGASTPTKPVTLAPDEKISFVVNPLAIREAPWPATTNSRLSFLFCLGNQAAKEHFYYFKSHHDAIRSKLLSGRPLRPDFLGD